MSASESNHLPAIGDAHQPRQTLRERLSHLISDGNGGAFTDPPAGNFTGPPRPALDGGSDRGTRPGPAITTTPNGETPRAHAGKRGAMRGPR